MKVITIGTDREIFNERGEVARRVSAYWANNDETHIIVFCRRSETVLSHKQITPQILAYSTQSWSRWLYVWDALVLGQKIFRAHQLPVSDTIVSCQDPFETGLAGYLLSRFVGCRLQLQVHTDVASPHFARLALLNRLRVWLARLLLPRATVVRVVSRRVKDSLVARFKIDSAKIIVQPVVIDLEQLRRGTIYRNLHAIYPQFDKIILMASRLTKEKNISLAIEAIKLIGNRNNKLGFVIVGSGPEELSLKHQVKDLDLSAMVVFEPWSKDLVSYYKTADLFLNTSWYEGYGRTMVEAVACGCKVVSTNVGVAEELGITIIPKFTAASVAESIMATLP